MTKENENSRGPYKNPGFRDVMPGRQGMRSNDLSVRHLQPFSKTRPDPNYPEPESRPDPTPTHFVSTINSRTRPRAISCITVIKSPNPEPDHRHSTTGPWPLDFRPWIMRFFPWSPSNKYRFGDERGLTK